VRIRSIRPEFWTSQDVVSLSIPHRLVFIGLWSYVDDNGVGRDVEALIRSDLFPLEPDQDAALKLIHGALSECSRKGMLSRYTVDGKPFLHITNFSTHQVINRPSRGRYPLPTCDNAETHGALSENSVSPHANEAIGEGEKGRRGEGEKAAHAVRATTLPSSWAPTVEHKERAVEAGLELDRETVKFRAHAEEKGRTAKNWNAAFTRWLMNAAEYATRDGRTPQPRTGSSVWDRPVRREDAP
jgi:hypothetical protein